MEFASNSPSVVTRTDEELYSLALKYRDCKVDIGLSAEESLCEAEKIFLQLANSGNSKAMHNYASIQQKKENYELAYEYWTRSDLPASKKNCSELIEKRLIKQDLYLIMGSERMLTSPVPKFISELQGSNVILTHEATFDGKAVTMDLNPSQVAGAKHIVADGSTFDFVLNKFTIKRAFFERLPTAAGDITNAEKYRTTNITGKCVQQVGKAMQSGATLELEWEPYCSMVDMNEEELRKSMARNPFQGFHSNKTALQAIYHLYSGGEGVASDEVLTWAEFQLSECEYYVDHGMQGSIAGY